MKENTDKKVALELASLLAAHGVHRVFISPGSRNAPLIVSVARHPDLETTVIVDERAAAFMALGYSLISDEPTALICTSGSALLNYAPAVAEAYYRKIPLIVVSADRPMEWIDQDDSQTLRQAGALANYVKLSCDIPELTTPNLEWYANRRINDALLAAVTGRRAPVHINIQLDKPLGNIVPDNQRMPRTINVVERAETLSQETITDLASRLSDSPRVMVIAGFNAPDSTLNTALAFLSSRPNFVVLTETISNLHSPQFISRIDTTLGAMDDNRRKQLAPDIVITLGGALVSRFVKEYLRHQKIREHWHIGHSHTTIDCFQKLTVRVELNPGQFFNHLLKHIHPTPVKTSFATRWRKMAASAMMLHNEFIETAPWSDLKAFSMFLPMIPRFWNVQLSNGTPVRYAQLFGDQSFRRSDCNRGVSGIEGCLSTAIGAEMAYSGGDTLVITGDMCAQYDIGAFSNAMLADRLKILVMCNKGGGIFRFLDSTAHLPELDTHLAMPYPLPLKGIAATHDFEYFEASNEDELISEFARFKAVSGKPALLAVHTDGKFSADVLRQYFNFLHSSPPPEA